MTPKYLRHLRKDPRLAPVLKSPVTIPLAPTSVPLALASAIISQQLSSKVAKILIDRFLKIFGGRAPSAERLLMTDPELIRGIGISRQKTQYILNAAAFVKQERLTHRKLQDMTDAEVIELLSSIKGVGRWSAEMLLIFNLHREDVFAVDDLGVQKAMIELFDLSKLPKKELRERMLEISRSWSPYRSYVCLHFWNFLTVR